MTDENQTPTPSSPSDEPSGLSEEDADAVQVASAAPEALGYKARSGTQVRERGTGYQPPRTSEEARETLAFAAHYCENCPLRSRCPEEICAVWRAEAEAVELLEREALRTPTAAGLVLRQGGAL